MIPKRHVEQLEDVERLGMYEFLHKAHQAVRKRFEPDATNVGINNGPEAGQMIAHLHWHIIPRYEGDVEDPTVVYVGSFRGNDAIEVQKTVTAAREVAGEIGSQGITGKRLETK